MIGRILGIRTDDLWTIAMYSGDAVLSNLYEKNKGRKRVKLDEAARARYNTAAERFNNRTLNPADPAYNDPMEVARRIAII